MIIGLDVGGTHTDVVLIGDAGLEKEAKVPNDPNDLFNSVLTGINAITADNDPKEISRIVLSTTLATNAIVQQKIPPVGMIVSGDPGINPANFQSNLHYYTVADAWQIDSSSDRGQQRRAVDIPVSAFEFYRNLGHHWCNKDETQCFDFKFLQDRSIEDDYVETQT